MKILVTGAKGFVGRNLCENLKNLRDGKNRTRPALTVDEIYEYDIDTDPVLLEEYCTKANFKQSVTIINVSFKDEVLMGQLTRTVSVTSGHSATYTVYGVEITEREDDRGNYDSWEENYTFAVTSGSPASRLDSYDKYNGDVSESMTSKEKSFTLVVDGVTVCSSEPISNVGKVDKVIGNYRYIF